MDDVQRQIAKLSSHIPSARYGAAWKLGKFKDLRALDPLVHIAQYDSIDYVRRGAIQALGKIGGNLAVETLSTLLNDQNPYVSNWTLYCMGDMEGEGAEVLLQRFSVDELLSIIKNPESPMRYLAGKILLQVDFERMLNYLLDLVLHDPHSKAGEYASVLLKSSASQKRVYNTLIEKVAPYPDDIRNWMIAYLEGYFHKTPVADLLNIAMIPHVEYARQTSERGYFFSDLDKTQVVLALMADLNFYDEYPIYYLLPMVSSYRPSERHKAIQFLSRFDHPVVHETMLMLLQTEDDIQAWEHAAFYLRDVKGDAFVDDLLQDLKHRDDLTRARIQEMK